MGIRSKIGRVPIDWESTYQLLLFFLKARVLLSLDYLSKAQKVVDPRDKLFLFLRSWE